MDWNDGIDKHMARYLGEGVDDERPVESCPRCNRIADLSDVPEEGVTFTEAICDDCREEAIRAYLLCYKMDSFDIAYERARANGWED